MTAMPGGQSFDVRIWTPRPYRGKRGTTYNVRWRVAHKPHSRTFATKKLADSFRAQLLSAYHRGEPFSVAAGLPQSMRAAPPEVTWYEHACEFVDVKWASASARHRKGIAEALSDITLALRTTDRSLVGDDALRAALRRWAFNAGARRRRPQADAAIPGEWVDAITWIRSHSPPISALADPVTLRRATNACATRLDGRPAAPATTARKRSALYSAMQLAVELDRLPANPVDKINQKRIVHAEAVDRRVVVNPDQARALLSAVRGIYPSLEAFFACLYYAGLRPAEARHLRRTDLRLPDEGWGELTLLGSTQTAGSEWTDSGAASEDRSLKHRPDREVRHVPAHPELVETLRCHLEAFEAGPDGRLFVTRAGIGGRPLPPPYSKPIAMNTVYRVWRMAREEALSPVEVASPLARRPYDLRHACLSTWLNSGVSAPQVAVWAGHSVNVLLRVYAKCVSGEETFALRRIEAGLQPSDDGI